MRAQVTWNGIPRAAVRLGAIGAIAATVVVGVPLAASASTHQSGPAARAAATSGVVYGGRTAQKFPVVIEMNKSGNRVVQAVIGMRLTCTSGTFVNLPDRYVRLPVKKRKFHLSFGPDTTNNADGTTSVYQGSISGAINKARSKVTGKRQLTLTERDAAGAVTDTCESGVLSWSAKQ